MLNSQDSTALIIISEEVEVLIPLIRRQKSPKVHLVSYAAPVTETMLHFNQLSYLTLPPLPENYKVPEWLSIELGIFAGRLYLEYHEVQPLSEYLHLIESSKIPQQANTLSASFASNPVEFVLEWISLRRKGQDVMHTPVGYVLQGRALSEDLHFFSKQKVDLASLPVATMGGLSPILVEEDYDSEDEDDEIIEEDEAMNGDVYTLNGLTIKDEEDEVVNGDVYTLNGLTIKDV
jgi:hypothetical protein